MHLTTTTIYELSVLASAYKNVVDIFLKKDTSMFSKSGKSHNTSVCNPGHIIIKWTELEKYQYNIDQIYVTLK